MDYNDKAESKQQSQRLMPHPVQSKEIRAHAQAIERAADFFRLIAERGELPLSPDEFDERVKRFYTQLDKKLELSNALLLALVNDELVPAKVFWPWASRQTIWEWSRLPQDQEPIVGEIINKKLMIRPSEFFRALARHGKGNK